MESIRRFFFCFVAQFEGPFDLGPRNADPYGVYGATEGLNGIRIRPVLFRAWMFVS